MTIEELFLQELSERERESQVKSVSSNNKSLLSLSLPSPPLQTTKYHFDRFELFLSSFSSC